MIRLLSCSTIIWPCMQRLWDKFPVSWCIWKCPKCVLVLKILQVDVDARLMLVTLRNMPHFDAARIVIITRNIDQVRFGSLVLQFTPEAAAWLQAKYSWRQQMRSDLSAWHVLREDLFTPMLINWHYFHINNFHQQFRTADDNYSLHNATS